MSDFESEKDGTIVGTNENRVHLEDWYEFTQTVDAAIRNIPAPISGGSDFHDDLQAMTESLFDKFQDRYIEANDEQEERLAKAKLDRPAHIMYDFFHHDQVIDELESIFEVGKAVGNQSSIFHHDFDDHEGFYVLSIDEDTTPNQITKEELKARAEEIIVAIRETDPELNEDRLIFCF